MGVLEAGRKMLATILVDNIDGAGLCGEWGLCVYIEHGGHVILLDAGASGLFLRNAEALGKDIRRVEYGVLSHAHYDHADGMAVFFRANEQASFFLRVGAKENCFGYHGESLDYGLYELYPGAYLLGHTTPGLSSVGRRAGLYTKQGFIRRYDDFSHEQTLVLEENGVLAVFSSCSHAGVENILREVRQAFPQKPIRALIGGFHLYETPPEEVRRLGTALRADGTEAVVTGHCTGQAAYELLRETLGETVTQMHTGLLIELA